MGKERFAHLVGNTITLTNGIENIDDTIIYVSPNGNDLHGGGVVSPYLTVTKALSAVTSTRKVVRLYPGEYTEAATLDWPDIDGVILEGMGARNDQVTIVGADGEDVVDIDPTTKTSTFDASIAGLTLNGEESECSGIRMDNGGVGSGIKFILFLNDVNISMDDDAHKAIEMIHTDNKTEAMRIYHHGANEFEGIISLEPEYAGDRFYFHGAKFPGGFAIGNGAVASRMELRDCIIADDSASGDEGNDAQIVACIGCASETGGTYAAVDKEDIGTNISSNLQII